MSEILAFTAENVCKLTGLSGRQLAYWDATDFFSPELLDEHQRRAFGRIYSFRDVVGLRAIAVLRNEHHIPLQELRRVGEWLLGHHATPWSSLRFALSNRKVVFRDPQTQKFVEAKGEGQSIIEIDLEPIASDMRTAASRLRDRRDDQIGTVVRNRYVVHNAWVVGGTRIPTLAIWNFHKAGYSPEEIVKEYPRLTLNDISAAIEFEANRHKAA
jgi:uncharacterized protein (DUF433 family)